MKRFAPHSAPSEIWVITTYFNFAGYRQRLANYRFFREHLRAPLLTIELSAGTEFALGEGDADLLVRCARGDVMWQKERLLNHGLSHLPAACRYVVWMDCDLLFENENWSEEVVAALKEAPLLQPFSRVLHAPAGVVPDYFPESPGWMEQPAVAATVNSGISFETCIARVMQRNGGAVSPGMAWAARRELLQTHGLFDASIIGGGDTALASAAFGCPDLAMELHHMNAWQRGVYLDWAQPFHQDVKGNVSHVPGRIIHLWHGEMEDRKPGQRHSGLRPHDFDPARDIAIGESGAWRWSSDKPALHVYLKDYFASRCEDGRTS
jgi:hypothetical protein